MKPGDFVYPHCTPIKAAVVLEVHSMGLYPPIKSGPFQGKVEPKPNDVTVRYLNGKTERRSELGLKDFMQLLEDHRKKVKTHEATLEKLKALKAKGEDA